MEYRFELSHKGREKLKKKLGPVYAEIAEQKLRAMGFGRFFDMVDLPNMEIAVSDDDVEQVEDWIREQAKEKLEEYLENNAINRISVGITGNRGVMKCLNAAGQMLASYDATSGDGSTDPRDEDEGPIPPGRYSISPIDMTETSSIGRGITIEIPDRIINVVKMAGNDSIEVSVDWGVAEGDDFISAVCRHLEHNYFKDWGSHLIALTPSQNTEVFGRKGFYIHGGHTPGSRGCIDIGGRMSDFVSRLMFGDLKRDITVLVTHH